MEVNSISDGGGPAATVDFIIMLLFKGLVFLLSTTVYIILSYNTAQYYCRRGTLNTYETKVSTTVPPPTTVYH